MLTSRPGLRWWLVAACLGGAGAVAVLLLALDGGHDHERASGVDPHVPEPSHELRLRGGPYRAPRQLDAGRRAVTLTTRRQRVEIGGRRILATVYNGELQPPTLHVKPGQTLKLDLVNRLREATNIHFHGLHVSPRGNSDNVFLKIGPGERQHYRVRLPDDHPPGLFWYHSHAHHRSSGQVAGGLAGLISVDGLRDLLPAPLRRVRERQIALKDIYTLPRRPDRLPPERDIGGFGQSPATVNKDGPRLINGGYEPTLGIRPGETQLWRIGNLGANMFHRFAVLGMELLVVAEDGNPVWETWEADSLILPPGKRFEVLVQGPRAGRHPIEDLRYRQGTTPSNALEIPPQRLGTLVSAGEDREPLPLPDGLRPRQDLDDAVIARERRFAFAIPFEPDRGCTTAHHCQPGAEGGKRPRVVYTINGEVFRADRVDVRPRLGTVEEWTLVNESAESHPFHIHVNDFQVMSVNGEPHDAPGLQDTVVIPPDGGEVVVRIPFEDFTGRFVFHCHILNHEDRGMMQTVDVGRR